MRLMTTGLWLLPVAMAHAGSETAPCDPAPARETAIRQIEDLRNAYARATDQIGKAGEADIADGRATYRRIFTSDARIGADGIDEKTTGPDAWVDVVLGALGPMGPTQHLIGTQVVTVDALDLDEQCRVTGGSARMESYLHAWHTLADGNVWIFLGNYVDRVVFTPGTGWQIADMQLERITDETRKP